jgi:hypothetical protein
MQHHAFTSAAMLRLHAGAGAPLSMCAVAARRGAQRAQQRGSAVAEPQRAATFSAVAAAASGGGARMSTKELKATLLAAVRARPAHYSVCMHAAAG